MSKDFMCESSEFNGPKCRTQCSRCKPAPQATEKWCQPADIGKHLPRKFIVMFEDAEQVYALFDDEAEARAFYAKATIAWNCYLFGALPAAPQPPVEGLKETLEKIYRLTVVRIAPADICLQKIETLARAALASPSLTAESSAQYRKAVDDLNRMNDKGEVAPATLIEQSGQKETPLARTDR